MTLAGSEIEQTEDDQRLKCGQGPHNGQEEAEPPMTAGRKRTRDDTDEVFRAVPRVVDLSLLRYQREDLLELLGDVALTIKLQENYTCDVVFVRGVRTSQPCFGQTSLPAGSWTSTRSSIPTSPPMDRVRRPSISSESSSSSRTPPIFIHTVPKSSPDMRGHTGDFHPSASSSMTCPDQGC
jgi:hypothetical protein